MTLETPLNVADQEPIGSFDRQDPYSTWQRDEGVPVVRGFYIEDLNRLEVGPWPRKGGAGAFVNLDGTGGHDDMHVVEIRPGGSSEPEHHMYEEMVYVLSGRGSTSVWSRENEKQTFEWGAGSVFSIPLNAWYQHFNSSGVQAARYVSVTNAPSLFSLFHSRSFIFGDSFQFTDRFSGASRYFSGDGEMYRAKNQRLWQTNFVSDVLTLPLFAWKQRGGSTLLLELADNSMGAHVSEFEVGTYKKAHRHGPGAHVVILNGTGYSLLWPLGGGEPMRCNWQPGTVIVPPENWFHQHFNGGAEPVRYLALRLIGRKYRHPARDAVGDGVDVSVKDGGWQVEYEDEDRSTHELFERELAQHGALCHMRARVPWCTGENE